MKSKDFGLLCAAITLFTFCGPVQAAGSRMELTIKNYNGCLAADGSYTAQVFWVQNRAEKDGSVRKDAKNPDKSLRNVDCDKIVIFKGLKYDASAKVWSGANIYDPVRGINASLKAWFSDSKTLSLKGSKMGFSETVTWTRL